MAFVGLDASVITVFVLRISLNNFFSHYPCKRLKFDWFLFYKLEQNRKKIYIVCLFFLPLPIVQGFKQILLQDQRMLKGFSILPFIPTWGCNVERNTISVDYWSNKATL